MSEGITVYIENLFENGRTKNALEAAKGKEIKRVLVDTEEDALRILFTDGTGIKIWDDGQSCCESRYMRTDDDLSYFVGATFEGAQTQDGPTETDEYGEPHETQFLIITTSKGVFTIVNHNEHNGYYGGFTVACESI